MVDGRYSTYLRISPFACAADAASMFLKLVCCSYTATRSGTPFRGDVYQYMEQRLESIGGAEELDRVKKTAWMRWLCFLLGPLPQAVRLASFRGISWLQVIGFSFVSSWLLVEISALVSAKTPQEPLVEWPRDPVVRRPRSLQPENFVGRKEGLEYTFGVLVSFIIAFCHMADALPLSFERFPPLAAKILSVVSVLGMIFAYGHLAGLVVSLIKRGCQRNMGVAQTLLVAFPQADLEGNVDVQLDTVAICWMVFAIHHFMAFLVSCYFNYDPSGTVNPGWTAVFG